MHRRWSRLLIAIALPIGCANGADRITPADAGVVDTEDATIDAASFEAGIFADSAIGDGGEEARPDNTEFTGDDGSLDCVPTRAFQPIVWAPPSPWGQGACSTAQLAAFSASCGALNASACQTFFSNPANVACIQCISPPPVTDGGAVAYGPLLTEFNPTTQMPFALPNVGGCLAHFDGDSTSGSCGNETQLVTDCAYVECGDCNDFTAGGDNANGCESVALSGACYQFVQTWANLPGCEEEGSSGASSICDNATLEQLIAAWCGPAQ